jgi:AraC-like DNA-binding protein
VPTFVHAPDVATVLVFRTTAQGRSDLMAIGPRTRGSYHPDKPLTVCLRLRLPPGHARVVLGRPVTDLVDRTVPIQDLWGAAGHRLTERLAAQPEKAHALLSAELLSRTGEVDPLIAAAVGQLSGSARLADVAGRLGVSERHLRNLFGRDVGLSPKHFLRISRVRTVLSLAGRNRWAAVADDAGFFDQAHMISDFRSMMGISPGAYLAGRLPAATACNAVTRLAD